MKLLLIISVVVLSFFSTTSFALDKNNTDLLVLNDTTFVKFQDSEEGYKILQLFKIEGDQINLVDAIKITEKKVSFDPLFQYKRLKIEFKD